MATVDIPTWLGVLLFIAGLAFTIGIAKFVARRERMRNGTAGNS